MIHLPIANIAVNTWAIIGLGAISGIASGLFGIGGGIISTPLLIFYGIPGEIAVGTSPFFLLGTSLSATLRNYKDQKTDVLAGLIMSIGSACGSFSGSYIMQFAIKTNSSDLLILSTYTLVMVAILLPIYLELVGHFVNVLFGKGITERHNEDKFEARKKSFFYIYSNQGKTNYNPFFAMLIGILGGLTSAIMGIGGGIIIVPAIMYFLHFPFRVASATSLFQIVIMSTMLLGLNAKAGTIDLFLGLIMMVSSSMFVHLGIYISNKITPTFIRIMLAMVITILFFAFLSRLFVAPTNSFIVI